MTYIAVALTQETKIKMHLIPYSICLLHQTNLLYSNFFDIMSLNQEHINFFSSAIKGRRRIPAPIGQTLHNIHEADKDSTERIFFQHGGVLVCAAYMFVQLYSRSGHSCPSVGALKNLVDFVNNLPPKGRQEAAIQLKAGMKDSESLEKIVNGALQRATRAPLPQRTALKRAFRSRSLTTSSDGVEAENSNGSEGLCNPYDTSDEPTQQGSGHIVSPLRYGSRAF